MFDTTLMAQPPQVEERNVPCLPLTADRFRAPNYLELEPAQTSTPFREGAD
jgi:hypothetical protein